MKAWAGTAVALAALALGTWLLGWPGTVFAVTGIVGWLLLQMSRLMRVMNRAGAAPAGVVPDAPRLDQQLHAGMKLVDLIGLTGSLGLQQAADRYRWQDADGHAVEVVLKQGRVAEWRLLGASEVPASP